MAFFPEILIQQEPKQSTPVFGDDRRSPDDPTTSQKLFSRVWFLFLSSLPASIGSLLTVVKGYFAVGPVISDTHANRANYSAATYQRFPFLETDRNLLYVSNGTNWIYMAGEMAVTQSAVSAIAAALTTADTGLMLDVTDYGHRLRWDGTDFEWAPGDSGSGMTQLFEIDPTGAGWHLYDGSTVNYLKADGTTGSVTLPNLAGSAAYLKAGTPNTGINAATPGSLTGNTDNASTGVTIPGTTGSPSGTTNVTAGGVAVASSTHTHSEGSVSDPQHHHTLTTVSVTGGEPQNIVRRPWFRQ